MVNANSKTFFKSSLFKKLFGFNSNPNTLKLFGNKLWNSDIATSTKFIFILSRSPLSNIQTSNDNIDEQEKKPKKLQHVKTHNKDHDNGTIEVKINNIIV